MKKHSNINISKLPDAILFDTDNTLYPYSPAHQKAMRAIKDKFIEKFDIGSKLFDKTFMEAKKIVKSYLKGTASSHSRLLYINKVFEILGLGTQILMTLEFEQTYWRTFLNNAVLFKGVKEMLEDLRLLEVPIAIVTDLTAQIQYRKMVYFDLDKFFDYVVTSEESGFDKPHPSSFKLAVEKLKIKGSQIWMIGDDPIADIKGAKDSIKAITFQKIHKGIVKGKGKNTPDFSFSNFNDLRLFIKNLKKNESK